MDNVEDPLAVFLEGWYSMLFMLGLPSWHIKLIFQMMAPVFSRAWRITVAIVNIILCQSQQC
jgi:hypothetical protein